MNTLDFILSKRELDLTQSPVQIPNVGRLDLIRWFRELDFKIGAELGVAQAELSKTICEINPQIKLLGVDAWAPYRGYSDYTKESTFKKMYDDTIERMQPYIDRDRFVVMREFTDDAAKKIEDNSLDFVYIDANHQDPFVTQDIINWTKKVRPGGIVAGHDYVRVRRVDWSVKDAIQKYTKDNNINPWFVLGSDAVVPGEVREGSRSWMFVR